MPKRQLRLHRDVPEALRSGVSQLEGRLNLPGNFPEPVLEEAETRVADGPLKADYEDATEIPFVSIDPQGSMDIDQILHIERDGSGFRVFYAIADVAGWVKPEAQIDHEARRRGQTFYAPTHRIPLHPPVLSEGAASLLADGVARPALLWRIEVDAEGSITDAVVQRAMVRNREKLTYHEAQQRIADETASESLMLLRDVGLMRQRQEVARGGVSLQLPEQLIDADNSHWQLRLREALPVEGWNAQISLMTGAAAAQIMLEAGVGILRTLPPVEERSIARLRRAAKSLELDWPKQMSYSDFVASLDPSRPESQAMLNDCTLLFRGAGYTVIDRSEPEQQLLHGALAMHYAHVTAPLRRLVDRFAGEVCVQICAGEEVPEWVLSALDGLPILMDESDRKAKAFENGMVNLVEAFVLADRKGERFVGTIIDIDDRHPNRGIASVPSLAVEAPVTGNALELGVQQTMELTKADVRTGEVSFTVR